MPFHEQTTYWTTCDECDWISTESSIEDWAAEQLDEHIREAH